MVNEKQLPDRFRNVIEKQIEVYNKGRSITVVKEIPDTTNIPIENPRHWLRIPDIICVFVDMVGSTKLSATNHDKSTAGVYQLFTNTAVLLFHEFDVPYIDVRGDGVFALFNGTQIYRAIAAAVTFKTFAEDVFAKIINKKLDFEVGCHIGIDQRTVLVKKIGLKRNNSRSDRQNEVWAGRPINMASKLASLGKDGQLIASDRYFNRIKNELVLYSCGCPNGKKDYLWEEIDLGEDNNFDFDSAFLLKSIWCPEHGLDYCEDILKLDEA